jgi:pimeloyl-ACP methyl ester carboxylesterase
MAPADQSFSAWDILPTITTHELLIAGTLDVAAPPALIEKTAELIPDCALMVYDGKGHEQASWPCNSRGISWPSTTEQAAAT